MRGDTRRAWLGCVLTHDNKKADEDGGERAHAEFERAALLYELAVLAPEALGAMAAVAGLAVDTRAAVATREVETLVLVNATLAVRRQNQTLTATRQHSNMLTYTSYTYIIIKY